MIYPESFRKKVLEYIDSFYTQSYVSKLFNISEKTVWNWVNQRKRTGSLKPKEVVRESPKLKSELLLQYVNDHPEAYLREIGAHFECAMSAVHKKLKKLGITYKKKS